MVHRKQLLSGSPGTIRDFRPSSTALPVIVVGKARKRKNAHSVLWHVLAARSMGSDFRGAGREDSVGKSEECIYEKVSSFQQARTLRRKGRNLISTALGHSSQKKTPVETPKSLLVYQRKSRWFRISVKIQFMQQENTAVRSWLMEVPACNRRLASSTRGGVGAEPHARRRQ